MKDSIAIILEAVPNSINVERLKEDLKCIDGVRYAISYSWPNLFNIQINRDKHLIGFFIGFSVFFRSIHSLNVWSLTVGCHILSVHIIIGAYLLWLHFTPLPPYPSQINV